MSVIFWSRLRNQIPSHQILHLNDAEGGNQGGEFGRNREFSFPLIQKVPRLDQREKKVTMNVILRSESYPGCSLPDAWKWWKIWAPLMTKLLNWWSEFLQRRGESLFCRPNPRPRHGIIHRSQSIIMNPGGHSILDPSSNDSMQEI